MKTFKIEIQEFLSEIVEVQAETLDEAILTVKELYINEKIILGEVNYVTTEINEYKDE